MKKWLALLLACMLLVPLCAAESVPEVTVSFRAENGAEVCLTAVLADNDTARALALMEDAVFLMADLNGNEKFAYLPAPLAENAEPIEQIRAGDILLFGSKCLVIFYQDAVSAYNYTRIGHIAQVEQLASLLGSGDVNVRFLFEKAE
ncbi:MAG: hypothetical protein E7326_00165 [Clostridiales bacterium]|nr:hypothetical protein [Clostridiales bacterium]